MFNATSGGFKPDKGQPQAIAFAHLHAIGWLSIHLTLEEGNDGVCSDVVTPPIRQSTPVNQRPA